MATRVPPNTENPFIVAQRGNRPDPFRPWTPSMPETPSLDGMVGLAKSAQAGLYASIQAPPEPQRQAGPTIRWSPAKQSFYVQGEQFEGRDARMALETEPLLGQPPAPEPGEGDWIPVPAEQYTAYLESIKNPTRGRLFSQNFEMGVDQLKQLGGSALQAVGAEETGQAIVNRAEERIQQVSPYAREFTGISEAGEGAALDWFVSVLGNQGPMILFSVATAIAGGGIGAVAGRGALAAKNAGMVSKAAQAMGRKEYAQKVMDAAAKYSAGAASKADKAILRQAAAFTGAAAGTFAGSMAIGTGDIYGEMRAEGAEPGVGSSLKAISGSIPYAALETLTEFLIAGRLLGFKGFAKQPKGMSALRKGAGYAGRAAAGVGIFGTTEALTEGSQEAIVLGLSGQNMLDDAAIERYINGMAAGFAVGGVLGGAANLRSKYEPADLMQSDDKEETPPPATPPAAPVGEPTVEYTGPEPRGSGPQGVLPFSEFSQLERARRSAQDTTTTPQLVWNPETLRYDLQGPESDALQLAPPQFEPNPDQGQLQFGPEAPATPAFGQPPIPQSPRAASPTPMAQAMQRASVDNAFLQAQQEQTLLRDDQYSRMEAMGRAQEQVNLLTPEERAVVDQQPEQAQLPMAQEPATPAEPAAPQQLPLFNQRQTPRPSRADRLRRGIDRSQQAEQELLGQARATALDIAADAQGLTEAGRSRQGNLFTQQGQPTVAALKSAGERIRRPQPVVEPSEPQTRPVRGLKKKAAAKKATAKKPLKKEKPDAVQERSAAQVDAREQASTGERVRGKDTQASQPARKSRAKEKPQESKPAVQQKQAVQKVAPLPAEEAWTDMAAAVDVYLPYSELSEADQRVWQAALDENAASPALAEQLFDAMEVTERQEFLADVQAIVQNADDMNMFTESVSNVVYHAFFDTNQNNAKNNTIPEARDFLQEREFNRNQQAVLNEIFLRQAGEAQRRDAFKQGKPQPWFSFAHSRGLLSLLPNLEMRGIPADLVESLVRDKHIGFRNLPESVWKKLPAELRGVAPEDKGPQVSPGAELAHLIEDTNDSKAKRPADGFKKLTTKLATLWEKVQDKKQEDFQTRFRSPLKDYFDEDGTPRVFSINGRAYVSNVPLTDEQRLAMAKVERDASRAAEGKFESDANETGEVDPDVARTERAEKGKTPADEPPAPRWTLDSWTTGRASMRTTDGKNITGPLPMNKVKTILSGFVNRLAKRPKVWLFKNQADLKARNPELYKKAKAGRNVFRYAATNIETRDSKGSKVRVYINPSVAQIKSMASAYRGKIVPFRYILDDKGDFFVWDANESLHEWMVHPLRKLGARIGNRERGVGEGWIRYHRNTDSVNRFQYDVDNAEQAANDTTIPDLPYEPPSNTTNDFDTMEASGYSFGWELESRPEVDATRRAVLKGIAGAAAMAKAPFSLNKLAGMNMDAKVAALYNHIVGVSDRFVETLYDFDINDIRLTSSKEIFDAFADVVEPSKAIYQLEQNLDKVGMRPMGWARSLVDMSDVADFKDLGDFEKSVVYEQLEKILEKHGDKAFELYSNTAADTINTINNKVMEIFQRELAEEVTQTKGSDKLKRGTNAKAKAKSEPAHVIIFTDRIFTTQQLKFVLAHETMGHFGLRGFIPQKKFDSLMLGLYDDNPRIRNDVDAAMNARPGMGKAEAVEEYLSDYAALLDTSIIARIWDALKGVFNRLNIQFGDESVRYFVHQARRYARTGKVSNAFEMQQIFDKLHEIEYGLVPPGAGRFSALDADFAGDMRNYGSNAAHIRPYDFTELDKAWDSVKKFIGNTAASFDKFKAKFFSLSNFRALENPGLYEFETLMDATRNVAMSIKVGLNEKLRDVLNKAVFNKAFGIKDEQIEFINDTLYDARMWAIGNLKSEAELGRQKLFYLDDNGEWQRSVDADGVPLVKKLADRGRISFEMMRDGFDYVVEDPAGDATKSVVLRHKGLEDWKAEVKRLKAMTNPNKRDLAKAEANVEILSNLTEDSLEWTGYNDLRDAVNELEEQLLLARYIDATNVRKSSFEEISTLMVNERLTKDDRDFINKTMNVFKDTMLEKQDFDERGYPRLNKDSVENAYEFIKLLNAAVIGQQTDRIADLEKFMRSKPDYFRGKLPDDILSGMEKFRERVAASTEAENKYVLQDKLKEILLSEISKDDADLYTKRSLATGYVPVIREGSSQVRVVAVNAATGQNVTLMENYRERLVYSMFDKPSEAKDMADYLNQQLRVDEDGNQKTYEVMAYDRDQQKFTMQKVRLLAIAEDSKTEVAGPLELNLNEFIRGLRFFDMQVTPAKMQAIVTQLTSQNAAARKRLQFSMTPGDKREGIKAISRHIESRASTIAKTMFRSQLTDLMNLRLRRSQQLWNATETVDVTDAETGKVTTKKKVDYLREYAERLENDPDAPEGARANARRTYERYKYMVDKTDAADVIKHGNRYWNEASRTMAFLDANKNVDESDFGSGRVVSRVRAAASLMQLGGSIATGSLNIIALYTNAMPYLATYNRKNGFGGGFGAGRSLAYLHVALKQVGALGIGNMDANRAEFYDEVAQDKKLQQRYGLEEHEARFIAQEIREGVMIPALSNALVGTARGFATTGARQKFIDTWMLPFNLTEQASRRSLGLASYRLEYARQLEAIQQEGIPLTNDQLKQARDAARRFAVDAIQMTMGEYSVLNRPAAWRSGLQSFMYMYKVFPTTSIQLMSRLSRTGQISMLTSLWLLGGMAATPFAEDIEDLVDTIAQALGFKAGSIRYEIAKAVDDLLPGMSPYVLGGFTNAFTHGNLGTRVALGNFIPGTGILLSGANVGRELVDIGGPAPSAIIGTANSLADLARAPFKANTGQALLDVAREAPVTMVRAAGDAYAFHQTGAIIDRRGYIVSEEAGKMTIAARLLGFYPVAASEQYDTIRMAKRIGDYQRDTVAAFRQSWIKARMAGDYAAARDVEAAVRDWNRGLRGSALEIKNFRAGSVRALREAQRPATERLRKGAARTARDDIDRIADLLSY